MFWKRDTTIISKGDFIDMYHKIKQKGLGKIFSIISSYNNRVAQKWDNYNGTSDFWIIPEIKQDWNFKISGFPHTSYEDYVVMQYLQKKSNLRLLSIGCGSGSHEQKFAQYNCFGDIIGVDLASKRIAMAQKKAATLGLQITYHAADFRHLNFDLASFDVVLFNSSLHHFKAIADLLRQDIKPLLKANGLLVVFEYCGPNRLQWTKHQLTAANRLLSSLPRRYKILYDNKTIKKKVYRPGLLRMLMVDPSEAPDSANLVAAIHQNFSVLEEKKLGWNLLHLALKGISHNFLDNSKETQTLLHQLISQENEYVSSTGTSDAVFGVYQNDI